MSTRLIVTADDFGMSQEVNDAVEEAHRNGILTTTSLVVAGAAAEDAIQRARRMPGLGVGLHLSLYGAPAQADRREIPGLLDEDGLGTRPVRTGARISLSAAMQNQVRREMRAQFDAFARSGLALDHLDGHWHCHQHPFVLKTAIEMGRALGLRAVRIPFEPPLPGWRISRTRLIQRAADAFGHWLLARSMRRRLRAAGIAFNDYFFGKNDGGAVTADYLLALIPRLPSGVVEIGLHPASRRWSGPHAPPADWRAEQELAGLVDPRVGAACRRPGLTLIKFADLAAQ